MSGIKRKKTLRGEVEKLMNKRIHKGLIEENEQMLLEELCRGDKNCSEISVAKAIVMAQGIRALRGDKGAAEFLHKLSDRENTAEKTSDDEVTVRVVMKE